MKKYTVLGGISPQKFLRDYWHKKPLLIRQAIPGFAPLLAREVLFALAADPVVESRLVTHDAGTWNFEHGPFKKLPSPKKKNWTLLVQGVNLHHDRAAALMEEFRFIPDARLDDLMISYASDGGGVGPHFDSYDVFLLQAHGKRVWRIGAQDDLALVPGLPLKILSNFQPEEEYTLEPGDMLYLPPHYAHDGIASGECMTYSIGFRAPTYQELSEGFLQFLGESLELPGRYADPDLRTTRHPAQVPSAMVTRVSEAIRQIAFDERDIAIFLGEYLTAPKAGIDFTPPDRLQSKPAFLRSAEKHGVRLARQTRMMYRAPHIFINGESFVAGKKDAALLAALADERALPGSAVALASEDVREALTIWYEDGWLSLD